MVDIWGAIAQYGIVPVTVGVILYLLIFWQTKVAERKRKQQEAENELRKQQQEIEREKHLIEVFKELVQEPKHTVEEQRENRVINEFIVKQLDCLVNEGADRAYMFSFHNGGKDVLGRGFLKMSMTQEDVADDIKPIMVQYQNMPRMLFPKLYEQLDEKDYYNVDDLEEIKKVDPFTYQFLTEHGAKSAMFRSIKREDGLMIGFLGMEYINKTCEDKKKAGRNIDKKVNRIIGALIGQNGG